MTTCTAEPAYRALSVITFSRLSIIVTAAIDKRERIKHVRRRFTCCDDVECLRLSGRDEMSASWRCYLSLYK